MDGAILDTPPDKTNRLTGTRSGSHATDERTMVGQLPVASWALTGVALTVVIAVHGWLLQRQVIPLGLDERYIAAFALRMIDGHWLPYVDAVSHRGPLLYWMASWAQWGVGPYQWLGIRLLAAGLCGLSVLACFAIGLATRRPFAGALSAALLAYTLCAATLVTSGLSLNGELVAIPFAIASVALTAWALVSERPIKHQIVVLFIAGISASLAVLAKQTASLNIGALLLWCVAVGWTGPGRVGMLRLREAVALSIGVALPLVLVALLYRSQDALGTLWYWLVRYNAEIYMEPYRGLHGLTGIADWWAQSQVAWPVTGCAVAALLMLGSILGGSDSPRPTALLRAYARRGTEATAALLVILGLISALAPLRMFPHYFVIVYPWLALLVGLRTDRLLSTEGALRRTVWSTAVAVVIAGFMLVGLLARLQLFADGAGSLDYRSDPLCLEIQRRSSENDAILVWGFDGDVYVSCHRRPATKFVYSTLVMGVLPPRFRAQNDKWVVPNSRQETAREIESARPALIIENANIFGGRRMTTIPELTLPIKRDYCAPFELDGYGPRTFLIYTRRDHGCQAISSN